jgi:RNA polymerase sigma factor (sigma-70 family)
VDRFDVDRDTRFADFASEWIAHAIRRALKLARYMLHIPEHQFGRMGKFRRAKVKLEAKFGREPSEAEIAHEVKQSKQWVRNTAQALRAASLRRLQSGPASVEIRLDALPDPASFERHGAVDPETAVKALSRIDPSSAQLVKMHFGLSGFEGNSMPLRAMGKQLGLTHERVRQLLNEALANLAASIEQAEEGDA